MSEKPPIVVRECPEGDAMLAEARRLRRRWLQLAHQDREVGISHLDPNGDGHIAYLQYCREEERLCKLPLPSHLQSWGWLSSDGSLSVGGTTWGGIAGGHGYSHTEPEPTCWPVTREEAYAAMGWELTPEPTEEEFASMVRMVRAMERIDTKKFTHDVTSEHGLHFSLTLMDREYLQELAANYHEIEAEEPDAK